MSSSIVALVFFAATFAVIAIVTITAHLRRERTRQLREQFGPEYARLAESLGDRHAADTCMKTREERAESFPLHALTDEQRHFTAH
jgi:hypothetical protein